MDNKKQKGFENQHEKILRLLREFNLALGCDEFSYIGISQHPSGTGEIFHTDGDGITIICSFADAEELMHFLTASTLQKMLLVAKFH